MKEIIKRWLENQKLESIKAHAKRVEKEANERYNIVRRINKDGTIEIYLTLDGERISTTYGIDYADAVSELFELRLKYQAEH